MTNPPLTDPADLDHVANELGLARIPELWRATWAESDASFAALRGPFPRSEAIAEACRTLGMTAPVTEALQTAWTAFAERPALQRLAWHCHQLLFGATQHLRTVRDWPHPAGIDLFYALVFLSGLEHILALHRAHGIGLEVSRATLSDLELWILHHRKTKGLWGLSEQNWLLNHFSGRLYALGRLQFEFAEFEHDFHAFRHLRSQRLIVLAGDGLRFRTDGQCDGTSGVFDPAGAWTSSFRIQAGAVSGNPVHPAGWVEARTVTLGLDAWEEVLRKGDPVLSVHIPATGPMGHADCGESFRRAADFFPCHFPEHPFRAFTCHSWLLDAQLERYLPAASNTVRFLQEMYLHPCPGANDRQTFERVFGGRPDDLAAAPRDTALRRAILQHIEAGGHWRDGGSLLFPEDLAWGSQVYRNAWSAVSALMD